MRRLVLVVAVAAAACGGRRDQAEALADCPQLVQHVLDLEMGQMSQMPAALARPIAAGASAYRKAVMESCTHDHWSKASVACLAAAKSGDDAQACGSSFTAEQQAHLSGAYAALMAPGKQAGERWAADTAAIVKRLCACPDAACRDAASHDYDAAMAPMRTTTYPDIATQIAKLDAKVAACKASGSGAGCDDVSCALDGSPPCCQKLKRAKP